MPALGKPPPPGRGRLLWTVPNRIRENKIASYLRQKRDGRLLQSPHYGRIQVESDKV